jgi:hypothetical protein
MRTDGFEIELSSPPDREKLVASILVEHQQWAEINAESKALMLELYPRQDGRPWVFDLDAALDALQQAKQRLVDRLA